MQQAGCSISLTQVVYMDEIYYIVYFVDTLYDSQSVAPLT